MAGPFIADRCRETTTSPGTGTINLAGAATGFRTILAGIGSGNSCYYTIAEPSGSGWEVGIGAVTSGGPDTLSRSLVIASSNGGAFVNFGAGTKDVFVTLPAGLGDAGNTNYLINDGFDFAQRQAPGTVATIAQDGYGPDRWRCCRENADLQYIRVDTDGSLETGLSARYYGKFTKITSTGKFLICQPLESFNTFPLASRPVVFQLKMKASASKTIRMAILQLNSSGTVDIIPANIVPTTWGANTTDPTLGTNLAIVGSAGSCSVTTAWANFFITATAPSNAKNLLCAVWSDSQFAANDWLAVSETGLYDSNCVLPWLPRLTQMGLAMCQRYYEKNFDLNVAPADAASNASYALHASGADATIGNCWVPFLVAKRIAPTIVLYRAAVGGTAGQWTLGTSGVFVDFTGSAGVTKPGGFIWSGQYGGSLAGGAYDLHGSWTADSEL